MAVPPRGLALWLFGLALATSTISACVPTRLTEIPDNAIIVDARTRTEYTVGHLGCAKSLPWYDADEEAEAAALGDKSRPVVVYCLSGHRSTVAMKRLEALGFERVYDGGSMGSLQALFLETDPRSPCAQIRESPTL